MVCTPESGPEGPGRRVELREEALVAAASVQVGAAGGHVY